MRRALKFVCLLMLGLGCGTTGGGPASGGGEELELERFDAGLFAMDKPVGWEVSTAGSCSTFAFLLSNPQDPLWRIFYFGTVGPVYLSQAQKDLDAWYVSQGGFPNDWLDAPVVDPLTPSNYLAHWPDIADMGAATAFMPEFPRLDELEIMASSEQAAMLSGGLTGNARGVFGLDGEVGEGMFLATVRTFLPYTGVPGGGIAYGHLTCGVTAPKRDFAGVADRLIESLDSFTVSQAYVEDCFAQQQELWGAVAEAGRTLSDASDIMWEGWQARTQVEDISAERWTDAYRNVERVYDPATGQVYEVPDDWYDDYDLRRNEFELSGLQLLPPDDWDLWTRAPLDGLVDIR